MRGKAPVTVMDVIEKPEKRHRCHLCPHAATQRSGAGLWVWAMRAGQRRPVIDRRPAVPGRHISTPASSSAIKAPAASSVKNEQQQQQEQQFVSMIKTPL
jgi:hypothetical protein